MGVKGNVWWMFWWGGVECDVTFLTTAATAVSSCSWRCCSSTCAAGCTAGLGDGFCCDVFIIGVEVGVGNC